MNTQNDHATHMYPLNKNLACPICIKKLHTGDMGTTKI